MYIPDSVAYRQSYDPYMQPLLIESAPTSPISNGRVLYVVAAQNEGKAFIRGYTGTESMVEPWKPTPIGKNAHLVMSGVGKANAAAATALALSTGTFGIVISIGIGGLLPVTRFSNANKNLSLGDVVLANRTSFADEGVQTDDKFLPMHTIGFPLSSRDSDAFMPASHVMLKLQSVVNAMVPVATVSTCSGTDVLAQQVADRTECCVEAMEGAAVMLVAARLGIPGAELRVISNTTGSRKNQRWDLRLAFETLERLAAQLRSMDDA